MPDTEPHACELAEGKRSTARLTSRRVHATLMSAIESSHWSRAWLSVLTTAVTGPPPKNYDFIIRVIGGSRSPLGYPRFRASDRFTRTVPRLTFAQCTSREVRRKSTVTAYPKASGFCSENSVSQCMSCSSNISSKCPFRRVFHSITTQGMVTGTQFESHATSSGLRHMTRSFEHDGRTKHAGCGTPHSIRICE